MPDIVISEFMDEGAVGSLSRLYDTLYDPELASNLPALAGRLGGARALIVRGAFGSNLTPKPGTASS